MTGSLMIAMSARRAAPISSGVEGAGSWPAAISLALTSGSFSAFTSSALRRAMTGAGVPAGAKMPYQLSAT